MNKLITALTTAMLAFVASADVFAQPQQACYQDTTLVDEVYGRKDTTWVIKPEFQKGDWNLYWDFALTKIKSEYHFNSQSEKIGITREYYKNGLLAAEWIHDSASNKYFPPGKEWYPNGKIKKERIQSDDTISETSYHPNGKINVINKWNRQGMWISHREWCDNGQLVIDYKPTSELALPVKKYSCSGTLIAEYNWYTFGYVGKYKEYHANGKISIDGQFTEKPEGVAVFMARKTGTWTYYDSKGKVTKKEKWENGRLISTE